MKFLIAEDDGISRLLLKRILLRGFECKIAEAVDGLAAWNWIHEQGPPDLLFLDIMMPRKNGIQLLKEIRSEKRFAALRVIVCTALSDRPTVTQVALLNVSGYVLKPFVAQRIVDQVRAILGEPAPRQPLESIESVQARLGIDAETYGNLLEMLIQDVVEVLAAVRTALANEDRSGAALRLNAIAGAARNLGATGVLEILARLESMAQSALTPKLIEELDRLEVEHQRLVIAAEGLPVWSRIPVPSAA
jgi:CheY-like chemotaxis protein